jgi:Holliday junction resolvase RusA-like endonuclease
MTEQIRFTVPAVPVAQPRPRAAKRGNFVGVYEAPKTHAIHAFKASVRLAAAAVYSGPPLEGPLSVFAEFVMPRTNGERWKTKPMPRYYHAKTCDLDNLIKGCFDALNKLLWHDDAQVAVLHCQKVVAAGDEQPHVAVTVSKTEPHPSPRSDRDGK